jgi:hypothetical protein
VAWLGPRGIVAAAVASLGAAALEERGMPGAEQLRALVFLTIAVTVVVLGGLGGVVARLLAVREPARDGFLVLGAGRIGLALAEPLRANGRRVTLLDANPDHCREATEAGWPVVFGNALSERTLGRARPEQALAVIGLTANENVNHLFAREAIERFGVPRAYVALEPAGSGLPRELLERHGIHVLFDQPRDVERWNVRLRHGLTETARFRFTAPPPRDAAEDRDGAARGAAMDPFLILTVERAGRVEPMQRDLEPKTGDEAVVLLLTERRDDAVAALAQLGWLGLSAEPESDETRLAAAEA